FNEIEKAVANLVLHAEGDATPPELYEHRATRKTKTYAEAQNAAFAALRRAGWLKSARGLKTPHATSPNGRLRLWFKPQAVWMSKINDTFGGGDRHTLKSAGSISGGLGVAMLPDMRSMTGSEFVEKIEQLFPKTLNTSRGNPSPELEAPMS